MRGDQRAASWASASLALVALACADATTDHISVATPSPLHCRLAGEAVGAASKPACPCAACDDGDPCTHDRCLPDGTCGRVEAAGCGCTPGCNAATRLTPLQALRQRDGGVAGLQGVRGIAASPEIPDAYAAVSTSGSVVWLREVGGGAKRLGEWPVVGASAVALSPAHDLVWVGTPTGLRRFQRAKDGSLSALEEIAGTPALGLAASSDWIATADGASVRLFRSSPDAVIPDGIDDSPEVAGCLALAALDETLYGAAFNTDTVLVWTVAEGLLRLEHHTNLPGLDGPNALAVSGGRLTVAGFCDGQLAAFAVAPGLGSLSFLGATLPLSGEPMICPGPDDDWLSRAGTTRGRLERPVALAASSDGTIAVHGLDTGSELWWFAPTETGLAELAPDGGGIEGAKLPPATAFLGGGWAGFTPADDSDRRALVHLAAGQGHMWLSSGLTDSVSTSTSEQVSAPLVHGEGGVHDLLGAYTLDLAPDGRHLYVAARGLGSLGVFAVDAATGALTQLASPAVPGATGRGDAAVGHVDVVGPDGRVVLATETGLDQLHLFERDVVTGELAHRSATTLPGCGGAGSAFPADVLASPDGRDAYVTDFQVKDDSCIYHLPLDGGSPTTVVSPSLSGIETLLFSPDGRDLYAACVLSEAVVHLRRDAETGALELRGPLVHESLYGSEMMALSPSGETLWASSPITDRLVVLDRDPASGALVFRASYDASPSLPIDGAAGLVAAPDGKHLYVAARDSAAITVLDVADGGVRLVDSVTWPGVLEFANGVRLSADGKTLYSAAVAASAVGVFRVGPGLGGACASCETEAR